MRNQIEAAKRLGLYAETINSTNQDRWDEVERGVQRGEIDALLISPERLSNERFVTNIQARIAERIGLLVVDEAHCISDWGHDFRPDYKRIVSIMQRMPRNMPILGTTATANDRVVKDVRDQLGNIRIQRGSLMRKSLALQTIRMQKQAERLAWLATYINDVPHSGIVYTLTKRDAEQVADWLTMRGIIAKAYYAGVRDEDFEITNEYREHLEDLLLSNKIKVLVATTALGMGYDKPDLGFVVHYQAPGSIVAYYQQVGRAGRGIDRAFGILMTGTEDAQIHEFFRRSAFPKEAWVQKLLDVVADSDGLRLREIERRVNLRMKQIQQVLKYLFNLNPAPVIRKAGQWYRTPVSFRMDHERIERLASQRKREWDEVQEYVDEQGCLMQFLASVLDDPDSEPCGRCVSCLGASIVGTQVSPSLVQSAEQFLRRCDLPLVCKKQVDSNAFPTYGFRGNLPMNLRAEEGRILSRWGDAGWGSMVERFKHEGACRDELVNAVADMIRKRWRPSPPPRWVTCVPSLNNPRLVPDYAAQLARRLGLAFCPVVVKLKHNDQQKMQQNRYRQCKNLDGVFGIRGRIPAGPVLLVDDIVDSGWTLTIIAALLLQEGSGPVYPLALATTEPST